MHEPTGKDAAAALVVAQAWLSQHTDDWEALSLYQHVEGYLKHLREDRPPPPPHRRQSARRSSPRPYAA